MEKKIVFEAKKINKSFGSTKALVDVDFCLYSGEVHGLIGENGSGKSTLSSIIAGVQPLDSGEMILQGQEYIPGDALEGNTKGIYMLLQERGTFENVSVAANIFVGKEEQFLKHGFLRNTELNKAGRVILDEIGADEINEKEMTGNLTFEEQKIVEIARAVCGKPEILIVDETTTALSRYGRDLLYQIVENLKKAGKSIIFISHNIDEVKSICDNLTILRDGHMIETLSKEDFKDSKIRQLMVGRDVGGEMYRADHISTREETIAIVAEHVSYGTLKDVNVQVHKGEIVGIGGLTDCGMHDLGKILFGVLRPKRGKVALGDGTPIKNTRTATKNAIAYVAKDRDSEALMKAANITDNICAPSYRKLQRFGLITKKRERQFAQKWAESLNVKMSSIDQLVIQLSGGNKQKVSVAKWVGFDADIFIFDCPTRGIDIGVKVAIYELMMELKSQGKAIIMISEELMEVIGMSDRVIIIKDGSVTGEFSRDDYITESKLIEYII